MITRLGHAEVRKLMRGKRNTFRRNSPSPLTPLISDFGSGSQRQTKRFGLIAKRKSSGFAHDEASNASRSSIVMLPGAGSGNFNPRALQRDSRR